MRRTRIRRKKDVANRLNRPRLPQKFCPTIARAIVPMLTSDTTFNTRCRKRMKVADVTPSVISARAMGVSDRWTAAAFP